MQINISALLDAFWEVLISWIPKIVSAIVVLLIGWIAGRAFGKAVSYVLDKIGVDDALRKTSAGKAIEERTKVSMVSIFDLIARWFVYLIALTTAVEILGVERLSAFLQQVVSYLPNLAAGVVIILFGFIVGDFLGDLVIETAKKGGLEWAGVFGDIFKMLVYFVVFLVGLRQMRIDITFLETLAKYFALGVAIGTAVGLGIAFGWGLKDVVKEYAEKRVIPRLEGEEK
ncbi:MAG TPA: hypothetical protein EYP68_02920 [Candidatus Korarchaeota archaeon]|nr:hypothetical protein [Candidatus Korarchaeota archaeon]